MRVAFNVTSALAQKSGIGTYINELVSKLLKNSELDIHLFCAYGWGKEKESIERKIQFINSLNSSQSNLEKNTELGEVKEFLKQIIKKSTYSAGLITNQIDICHEPNFLPISFNKPTVITVHDLSPIRVPQFHKKDLIAKFEKRLPNAIKNASGIIVDSEFTKNEMLENFPESAKKIFVIHLAAGENFKPINKDLCLDVLANNHLTHKKYLLCVGTLEPRKNLVSVVRAYVRLPEKIKNIYPLVIVGAKGWLNDEFDHEANRLIQSGNIRLIGYVKDFEIPILYSAARLFIYPSIYEGFGLPILEAMGCGVPVICSNRASMPEVCGEAARSIDPYDEKTMADEIISFIEDDQKFQKYSDLGVLQAKKFNWDITSLKTAEVYKKVYGN